MCWHVVGVPRSQGRYFRSQWPLGLTGLILAPIIPCMTAYTTPPVIIFGFRIFITRGGIPWEGGIHRTPGDKLGGRLGF